jgi:hypothetical protein
LISSPAFSSCFFNTSLSSLFSASATS